MKMILQAIFIFNVFSNQLYRSDSDSSTLPRKSPFVRNTLERRTLRYKQVRLEKWTLAFIARTIALLYLRALDVYRYILILLGNVQNFCNVIGVGCMFRICFGL